MTQKVVTKTVNKDGKIDISYSKLSLFESCPKQFYFRYLRDDIKEKQIIWPGNLVGQVFHDAMEYVINAKNDGETDQAIIVSCKGKFKEWYDAKVEKAGKDYKKSREVSMGKDKWFDTNDKFMISLVKFVLSYFFIPGSDIIIQPEERFRVQWEWDEDIILNGIMDVRMFGKNIKQIFDLKVTKDSSNFFFVDWDKAFQKIVYEYYTWKEYGIFPDAFSYIVFDRGEKYLFFKSKQNEPLKNAKVYFSELDNKIRELKEFILCPEEDITYPEELKCKWCAFSKRCDDAYENKYVKSYKGVKK